MAVKRDPGLPGDPIDLYLRWGLVYGFGSLFKLPDSVGLLIQWKSSEAAQEAVRFVHPAEASLPAIYLMPRGKPEQIPPFWSITVPVKSLGSFLDAVKDLALTIKLAAPVTPSTLATSQNVAPALSTKKTLMAVLDDGCAFANASFRDPGGTRVIWLWNQNTNALGAPVMPFGYGGQWSKADLDLFFPAGGTQDEAYRDAGLPGLRRSAAHGTHVMDLLAGEDPTSSNSSDIVFVQFPKEGIEDPTGLWLERYAWDGLLYVVANAGAATKRIVVNISWGPQTGPHDGTYQLEAYIDWLIQVEKSIGHELIVTLPAGNSFSAKAHGQVSYRLGGSVDWILPPDGEIQTFVEFWWPKSVLPVNAHLQVIAPGQAPVNLVVGSNPPPPPPDPGWRAELGQVGSSTRALVTVNATAAKSGVKGRDGRWQFVIPATAGGAPKPVDIYVARSDHNMGAQRRAKASYLTDAGVQKQRFVAASDRYKEATGSAVRRAGTLNGIATGKNTFVAAGYVLEDRQAGPYSSSGPTRGPRKGPNFAMMTDRSEARPGIRAAGVRTGTKVLLVGTSTAAPQLGRMLAKATKPPPKNPDPERTGMGELDPVSSLIDPE
jgi:hypothetical protein